MLEVICIPWKSGSRSDAMMYTVLVPFQRARVSRVVVPVEFIHAHSIEGEISTIVGNDTIEVCKVLVQKHIRHHQKVVMATRCAIIHRTKVADAAW